MKRIKVTCIIIFLLQVLSLSGSSLEQREQLEQIDVCVHCAIEHKQIPGAEVLVAQHGEILYHKAFGNKSLFPTAVPLTINTIFDCASMTKALVTAPAILSLAEHGQLDLKSPVARYMPELACNGKENITIEQLLLHTSGIYLDFNPADYVAGPDVARKKMYALAPSHEPGLKFTYSDTGYIILGDLFERLSGQSLNQFAQEHIFRPLGMYDTMFLPPVSLRHRIAPTGIRDGSLICGSVHDQRTYNLGGVAGHAGLFSSARDLFCFGCMMLHNGMHDDTCIFSPSLIRHMTKPWDVGENKKRTLGWDVQTQFSSIRGDYFPHAFGHTGFTGTSMMLDPDSQIIIIILSNRVHPELPKDAATGIGNIYELRRQVANVVALALI